MEILMFCVQQKQNQMNLFPIISSYISIISPYILDVTDNKGGLMVFVKLHIPLRRLNDFRIPSSIQILPFEIDLRKKETVRCINLQDCIPEFSRILLNLVWKKLSFLVILTQKQKIAYVLQYDKTEYTF